MQRLVQSIETILACYDCAVVPGLGGFLMNRVEARYDASSHRAFPAYRQVSFNAQLTFNDGLLAQVYQKTYGLSFEEANHAIKAAVDELFAHLDKGETLELGETGRLHQTPDRRLVFEAFAHHLLDADSYGLEDFTVGASSAVAAAFAGDGRAAGVDRRSAGQTASEAQPAAFSFWKWTAAVAASLILSILFSTDPIGRRAEHSPCQASLFPATAVSQCIGHLSADSAPETELAAVVADVVAPVDAPETPAEVAADVVAPVDAPETPAEVAADVVAPVDAPETPAEVQPLAEAVAAEPSVPAEKAWFIVIASFPSRAAAEQHIQNKKLSEVFPEVGITVSSGRYRVYAAAVAGRSAALDALSGIRSQGPAYEDAWICRQ